MSGWASSCRAKPQMKTNTQNSKTTDNLNYADKQKTCVFNQI